METIGAGLAVIVFFVVCIGLLVAGAWFVGLLVGYAVRSYRSVVWVAEPLGYSAEQYQAAMRLVEGEE